MQATTASAVQPTAAPSQPEPFGRCEWLTLHSLRCSDASEIKSHAFFRGIDFDALPSTTPPFVPDLRHPTDTRYAVATLASYASYSSARTRLCRAVCRVWLRRRAVDLCIAYSQ